jgi:N-acetyl-alpha-D-muramate 1-phosphate uridylyltransferase
MLPVAILAGGLATRLRPVTETIPKALIEIAGKPFIIHQLEYLRRQGVTSVVLCIGYLGEMIQKTVGSGNQWGLNITYSLDGSTLLGTGGAIKRAIPFLGNEFFILYGDSYLPINFSKVQKAFINSGMLGLMTVYENKNQWDRSNVEFIDGELLDYDKKHYRHQMKHIDYGLSVMKSCVFDGLKEDEIFDLSDLFHQLAQKKYLYGYEVFQRFYEIGTQKGIMEANEYFRKT